MSDPNWAARKFLLPLDGNKTDEVGATWSNIGTPTYTASNPPFVGVQSLEILGTTTGLLSPTSLGIIPAGPFCLEWLERCTSTANSFRTIVGNYNGDGANTYGNWQGDDGQMDFYSDGDGVALHGGPDQRNSAWWHCQLCRDSSGRLALRSGRIGIDSTTVERAFVTGNTSAFNSTLPVRVGLEAFYNGAPFYGQLAQIRLTVGIAPDFTVPTAPWPIGASGGASIDGAGNIASGEAFGSLALGATVAAAGVASAQAVGSPSVGARISATGIASAEAVGAPTVGGGIAAAGIASSQAVGAPVVGAGIVAAGIASGEAVGAPIINGSGIFAAGIPSAETFGSPAVGARIVALGIVSGEAVGQPTIGTPAPAPQRLGGFEMSGAREVSFKPLMQRILEAREARRVKPAKPRAAKRAKAIEVEAALVALDTGSEQRFRELMAAWLAQRPVLPPAIEPSQAFMAQVMFRLQQMKAEDAARAAIAAAQRNEEDALIALLLA